MRATLLFSMLLIVFSANSQVIHTNIADREVLAGKSFKFNVTNPSDSTSSETVQITNASGGTFPTMLMAAPGSKCQILIYANNPQRPPVLNDNVVVHKDSAWTQGGTVILFDGGGYWNNVSNKYLGLRVEKNGQWHYGWVKMDAVTGNPGKITVKEYAYNATPNSPITTGQTTAVQTHSANEMIAVASYSKTIFLTNVREEVSCIVLDMNGRLINKRSIAGNNKIDMADAPAGVYIVFVSATNFTKQFKVLLY